MNFKKILGLFMFIFISAGVYAQKAPPKKKVKHENSDLMESNPAYFEGNLVFSGNVKFSHNGAILTADSVIYYQDRNFLEARRNVYLDMGPKGNLKCDRLEYDGNTEMGVADKNVVLKDASQILETDKLFFDRKQNLVYYTTRSKITQKGNIMYSDSGKYHTDTQINEFQNDVLISTAENNIRSNKIDFNNQTGIAYFVGPTYIEDKKKPNNYIYTELGNYNTKTKEAFLEKNSRIQNDGRILSATKMYFNEKTGFGKGNGNVLLDEPKEKRFIRGEYGEVYRFKDSAMVTEKAYAVKVFEKDSLYISAKKFTIKRDKNKESILRGYNKARFYKSDMQGRCDSLVYKETLREIYFYKDPIFWSEDKQITGDTIIAFINSKQDRMDSIRVFRNAFAISKADSLTKSDFNQVKGRRLLGLFNAEGDLVQVQIEGNGESIVFVDEEDKEKKTKSRVGINKAVCGIIIADFIKNDINIVTCKINAEAKLFPEDKFPVSTRYLSNFVWQTSTRLKRWQDIFLDSPNYENEDFKPSSTP